MSKPGEDLGSANRRLLTRLGLVILGMFGFVFALVPLYNVFCDITGLNGKTANEAADVSRYQPDLSRTVVVQFVASVNESMPWDFKPNVTRMEVHPGQTYQVSFHARNLSDRAMVGQAIPSVAPGEAAPYFKKTECFCFTEQRFEPGEGRDMPLIFMVDPELPEDVNELALAYTFFDKQKLTRVDR